MQAKSPAPDEPSHPSLFPNPQDFRYYGLLLTFSEEARPMNMKKIALSCALWSLILTLGSAAQTTSAPVLPYTPSLDVSAMDRSIDTCVEIYHLYCIQ